jgi:hypothetical protein
MHIIDLHTSKSYEDYYTQFDELMITEEYRTIVVRGFVKEWMCGDGEMDLLVIKLRMMIG